MRAASVCAIGGKRALDRRDRFRLAAPPLLRQFLIGRPFHQRLEHLCHAFVGAGTHEMRLEPAQAKHFPDEIDNVAHPDFLEHIGRLECAREARHQVVIAGRVLARDQWSGCKTRCGSGEAYGAISCIGGNVISHGTTHFHYAV